MKRLAGIFLAGLLCLSIPACGSETHTGGAAFQKLGYKEALAEAGKQKKVVMIDFGATWCGPCRQMEETTFHDAEVQKFLRDHSVAIKVDIDQNQSLAGKFSVTSIPAIVFVDSAGNELGRMVGYQSAQQFLTKAAEFKR